MILLRGRDLPHQRVDRSRLPSAAVTFAPLQPPRLLQNPTKVETQSGRAARIPTRLIGELNWERQMVV